MTQPQPLLSLGSCKLLGLIKSDGIIPVRWLLNRLAPFVLAFCFSDGDSLSLMLKSAFTLELRNPRKDREHQLALGCGGVNVLFQGYEGHFLFLKLVDDEEELLCRPGKAGIGSTITMSPSLT